MTEQNVALGLGWVVNYDEFQEMQAIAGEDWFEISDCFHLINGYADNTEVFIGELYAPMLPGSSLDLIYAVQKMQVDINSDDFSRKFYNALAICGRDIGPTSPWAEANMYIVNRIV